MKRIMCAAVLFAAVFTNAAVAQNTLPAGLSLDGALAWLKNNAAQGGAYTITLKNDETIAPRCFHTTERTSVSPSKAGPRSDRSV